jgi:hypothetical protein
MQLNLIKYKLQQSPIQITGNELMLDSKMTMHLLFIPKWYKILHLKYILYLNTINCTINPDQYYIKTVKIGLKLVLNMKIKKFVDWGVLLQI